MPNNNARTFTSNTTGTWAQPSSTSVEYSYRADGTAKKPTKKQSGPMVALDMKFKKVKTLIDKRKFQSIKIEIYQESHTNENKAAMLRMIGKLRQDDTAQLATILNAETGNKIRNQVATLKRTLRNIYQFKSYRILFKHKSGFVREYESDHYPLFVSELRNYIQDVKHAVKQDREQKKEFIHPQHVIQRNIGGIRAPTLLAFTNIKPNAFIELQLQKKVNSVFKDKKPITDDKYVGVELEFCLPTIDKMKLAKALYDEKLIDYCTWHEDRSLRPRDGELAHELSMLAKESEIFGIVKRVCDILNKLGAVTEERRCGMHVHFDLRNRNKEVVYHNLVSIQRWLLKMVPSYRRNNEFSKTVKSKRFPKNFDGSREERYKTINAAAYYKHKTVEIRLHEGTTDVNLISSWIELLLKVVNHKSAINYSVKSLREFNHVFRLNKKLRIYIMDRINQCKLNDIPRPTLEGGISLSQDVASPLQASSPEYAPSRSQIDWSRIRETVAQDVAALSPVSVSDNWEGYRTISISDPSGDGGSGNSIGLINNSSSLTDIFGEDEESERE